MKNAALMLLVFASALALMSCTAGPNTFVDTPDGSGDIAGFWLGLWQGLISPITFVVSLFSSDVQIYEVHNNGGWYNFGFTIAILTIGGGGGAAGRR